jgi:hypothetical protein
VERTHIKPVTPEERGDALQIVIAKDQPQYIPLPANTNGTYVETKWKLSWKQRWQMFKNGHLYLTVKTFGSPLQPLRLTTEQDEQIGGHDPDCTLTLMERMSGFCSKFWEAL